MTDLPAFPRDVLAAAFNDNPRMITAFEELIRLLGLAVLDVETASSSVVTLAGTEFVLAAANTALEQALVLTQGGGITVTIAAGTITVSHPITVQGGAATFLLTGDTNLVLPLIGTVATTADIAAYVAAIGAGPSYANDAAAAGGGVPIGGGYRNGSVFQIRIT